MARKGARHGGMAAIAALVTKVYPGREPGEVRNARIFGWWYRAVPDRIADHARPVRLQRGTLWVHTTSVTWANHLQYVRDQLLASLQQHAPTGAVRDVRFRAGPLPPRVHVPRPEKHRPPVLPLAQLPEEVAVALAGVRDDALRETLMKAAAIGLAPGPGE